MKRLSVEQQIDALRPTVKIGLARTFHLWLICIALALVILSIVFWHPAPFMLAVFLGIVGFSEQQAGPNLEAAINAFDHTSPSIGQVSITITCWDTDDHFHTVV